MFSSRLFRLLPVLALIAALALAASAHAAAQGSRVLLIVAKKDFADSEYRPVRAALDAAGAVVTVASDKVGNLSGQRGLRVASDIDLADVQPENYDAVVVIGGNGIKRYWTDDDAVRVVRGIHAQGGLVAAICAGPGLLAEADVLQGVRATCHPSSGAGSRMGNAGAEVVREPVVVSGQIITADGPGSADEFAQAIVDYLNAH